MCSEYGISYETLTEEDIVKVERHEIDKLRFAVYEKPSLQLMPWPTKMWAMREYITDAAWSKTLASFRAMNAGLGNRDAHFRDLSAMSQNGRVLACPLCQHVRYNEIHVLVECVKLQETRKQIIVDDNMTVTDVLVMYKRQYNTEVSAEIARLFVGQDIRGGPGTTTGRIFHPME